MSIIEDIKLVKTEIKKTEPNSATFCIEPFYPGFGITIGHTLRRILLSSLKGSAPTSMRIEGVSHEFSTIKGVKEDVVNIMLNIKQMNVKSYSEEPVVIKLKKTGPAVITAADFNKNAQIEIQDPNYIIAHLNKGAKFDMEITIEHGTGYVPVEKRKNEKLPIGTIAIDAIYNPVKKMNYEVVNTRVGGITNYDKLILNITTNGSITPEEAFARALEIAINYFSEIKLPKTKNTASSKKITKTTKKVVVKSKKAKKISRNQNNMLKKKLGRKANHRKQTLMNLASAIILYEKITTTKAKAKAVAPIVERVINTAKKNDLTSRRKLLAFFLHNKHIVNKIINDIAPRFKNSSSGYLKLFNVEPRLGDSAPMITIILSKSKFLGNYELPKDDIKIKVKDKLKDKNDNKK